MYMSSFLTSSPVTWSNVRPSDETTAYLAPSYRRTSKLTPSYSERSCIRRSTPATYCNVTQLSFSRTHTHAHASSFPPVDISAEEISSPDMIQLFHPRCWQSAPERQSIEMAGFTLEGFSVCRFVCACVRAYMHACTWGVWNQCGRPNETQLKHIYSDLISFLPLLCSVQSAYRE